MTVLRPRNWWAISAVAILVAGLAAGLAYNIGLSQGLAQVPVPSGSELPQAYGWHRPWGFGFVFPLMFFAFWFLMWSGVFWRPWRPWHYGYGPSPRDRFDAWHREAHERMDRPRDSRPEADRF
jgi:hypothetical protein